MIRSLKFCPQNQKVYENKKQNLSRFNILSQASQFQFLIWKQLQGFCDSIAFRIVWAFQDRDIRSHKQLWLSLKQQK